MTEKWAGVKSKLAASRVECVNFRWSAHSVTKGASKVEDNVSNVVMAVSGEVTGAAKRKVSIIGLELKDVLK